MFSSQSTDAQQEIKVNFVNEVFRIEMKTRAGSGEPCGEGVARMKKPDCDWCKDNPRRKCKHCACCVCGGKDNPDKQLLCDECNMAYHLWCLSPKLDTVPDEDDWLVKRFVDESNSHPTSLPPSGTVPVVRLTHRR